MSEIILTEQLDTITGGVSPKAGNFAGPCFEHVVVEHDTLAKIAAKYGTTTSVLIEMNHLSGSGSIRNGQRIKVPAK